MVEVAEASRNEHLPTPLQYTYAIVCIGSALFTVTGTYRDIISFLTFLSLPEFVVSALAGALQLIWQDLAYLTSKPLRRVELFVVIPYVAAGLNVLGASVLLLWRTRGVYVVLLNLIFGFFAGLGSMAALIANLAEDSWRTVAAAGFLIATIVWLRYFWNLARQERRLARSSRR